MLYIFRKVPWSSCNTATYRFRDIAVKWSKFRPKIRDFRDTVPPEKERKPVTGPISTIMQNFTPIGGTVAEISGAIQKTDTADLIKFRQNAYTSVAFVYKNVVFLPAIR